MTAAVRNRLRNGNEIAGSLIIPESASNRSMAEYPALIAEASEAEEWQSATEFIPW